MIRSQPNDEIICSLITWYCIWQQIENITSRQDLNGSKIDSDNLAASIKHTKNKRKDEWRKHKQTTDRSIEGTTSTLYSVAARQKQEQDQY